MRAVYVSYDGALDPLGASQIVPYLLGLSGRGVRFTLVTFEKRERWSDAGARDSMQATLRGAGVGWVPLPYHRRPRLLAKALDVIAGARAIRRAGRTEDGPVLLHCRGELPMAMARSARVPSAKILYDIRGFYADERVEGGSWTRGGVVDRAVRALEGANFRRADGFVALTEAARRALAERHGALPPHRVIPTCVDLDRFRPGGPPRFSVVYGGSLGSAYPSRQIVAFARVAARALGRPALLLTPQRDEAFRAGAGSDWAEVHTVSPAEMPSWLQRCQAAFCLYKPGSYLRATSPTKVGEALATGLPVAVNRGVGDLDDFLEAKGVGVSIGSLADEPYEHAAERLAALTADPETATRCRRVAEERYALTRGVEAYFTLYAELLAVPSAQTSSSTAAICPASARRV